MRKLYLDNGNEQFKFADTTTEIRLNAFDDGRLASLTADAKVRVKNDSGYLLDVSASVTNNQAVITSGQLAQLPAGSYLLELWNTVNGGTAIYPSDGFLRLQINENVAGLSGKLVSSITVDDFIQQFSDLSQQLKKEASAVGWSSEVADKINNAIKGLGNNISRSNLAAPYDSLDTLPLNTVVTYDFDIANIVRNAPSDLSPSEGATLVTYTAKNLSGAVQILVSSEGECCYRVCWNYPERWRPWNKEVAFNNAIKGIGQNIGFSNCSAPYDSLDTLPNNSVVTYAMNMKDHVNNLPSDHSVGATVFTYSSQGGSGNVQILVSEIGTMYYRVLWGYPATWTDWKRASNSDDLKNMLENMRDSIVHNHVAVGRSELEAGSQYTDLNNPFDNTLVLSFSGDDSMMDLVKNAPVKICGTLYVIGLNKGGQVQLYFTRYGQMYYRVFWGAPAAWTDWKAGGAEYSPKPSLSLFQKIGVIGDSYASGWLAVDTNNPNNHYEISWPQILARKNGTSATNFTYGGLTTRSWLTHDHGLSLLNSSGAQDLYICALGINDLNNLGESYIGSESDIDSGADTFYGNYGKIIKSIQSKAPEAKIVISTLASTDGLNQKYNSAIETISKHFGIALIKQSDDPFFNSDYYHNHMYGGHPTGPVYAEMANAIERLISQQMVDNLSYFETYKK